ncbi:MAG: T9SS type A sorting domain-containing protein [Bacteroidia bacterium]
MNDWTDFGTKIKIDDIDEFTFSAWVQPGSFKYPQNPNNLTKKYTIIGNASNGGGFRFSQYKAIYYFQIQKDKDWRVNHERNSREKNSWAHLVGVSNSGWVIFYVNGTKIDSFDHRTYAFAKGTDNFEVGRGTTDNSTYWEGAIDDIRIYNKSLTPGQVSRLYNAEKVNGKICTTTKTIEDTITTEVFDTTLVFDTIPIYDTLYKTVYDTLPFFDTLLSQDTLSISIATGISPNPIRSLIVYPNPATANNSELMIEIDNIAQFETHVLSIVNMKGQEVWKSTGTSSKYTIKISNLGGIGLYHLNIHDPNGSLLGRSTISVVN